MFFESFISAEEIPSWQSFFVFVNLHLELGLALHLLMGFLQKDPVLKSAGPFFCFPVPSKSPCSFGVSLRSLTRYFRSVAPGFSFQLGFTRAEVFFTGFGTYFWACFLLATTLFA